MPETQTGLQTVAVIDIGSSAIRMVIAELGPKNSIRQIENLSMPVLLGKDVFTTGRIGKTSIQESMTILANYKQLLDSYKVERIHAIATSAVREAANRDNFIDKIFIRTGIDVEVIEGIEENRLDLLAVEKTLSGSLDFGKLNALIVEAGAGSTEIIVMTKGQVELSRTLPLGSVRLPQNAVIGKTEPGVIQRLLKRSLSAILEDLNREYNIQNVDTLIAMGGDMRLTARHITGSFEGAQTVITGKDFGDFVKSIAKLSPEETALKLRIPFAEAETIYPATLIYSFFLQETKSETIIVPAASIRDGILFELGNILSGGRNTGLSRQVINSAKNLGRKYKYDESHALNVTALSLKLFDALAKEYGLDSRERFLLEIAALLHDIGIYISPSSHHKHSMYLVEAAEIFGLRKAHKDIVANIVRYHRRSLPKPSHTAYMSLPRNDRTVVSKLAAILRAADALDNSHQQKIKDFKLEHQEDNYIIRVDESAGDIALERQSLAEKSDMFSEIYGLPIVLKTAPLKPA